MALATRVDTVVVGAGFGGIAAAIKLRERGVADVMVVERAGELGGAWRDNTYPGCRCDVQSNLYSLSFAPNPGWTDTFSAQPEIWSYLDDVARRFGVRGLISFDTDVLDVRFDDAGAIWRLATSRGDIEAAHVILATGGLAEPKLPEIAGIETFAGDLMHSARWDHAVALAGHRVGVIGTGASAIQLIPAIAPDVARLTVFQRTPGWVLAHPGHRVRAATRRLYERVPLAQRLARAFDYWTRELLVLAFVKDPERMRRGERMALAHLASQVDDPVLREQLTPHFTMGCKRVLLSDDYYPALARDNVELETRAIVRVEPGGVALGGGTLVPLDVLICATGFYVTDNPMAAKVHGRGGRSLAAAYEADLPTYLGTAFPGFPNLFMLTGPNTGLGHSSMLLMIESQLAYVADAIARSNSMRGALVEPRMPAARAWTDAIDAALPSTVWGTGCTSWYLNEHGRNPTIWPGFTFTFRRATRSFRVADHVITLPPRRAASAAL
jgi:cation diffusion facilitator CzcD-associated flavoprotein CzcO